MLMPNNSLIEIARVILMSNKLKEIFTIELTEKQAENIKRTEDRFLARDYNNLIQEFLITKQKIFEYSKLPLYWFDIYEFNYLLDWKEKIKTRMKEIKYELHS